MKLTKTLAGLDLETTGLSITQDRIVQIAIIFQDENGILEEKVHLINTGIPIPAEATAVHGKTDEMVAEAPRFSRIARDLYAQIKDCDITGHNILKFDIPLLSEEFDRCGIEWPLPGTVFVDTQRYEQILNSHRLTDTYRRYTGLEIDGAHDALNDTRAAWSVLNCQTANTPDITPEEIYKLTQGENPTLDFGGWLAMKDGLVVWTFGKHKGRPVKDTKKYAEDFVLVSDFPAQTKRLIREIINPVNPQMTL